jgi:flagellar hook protein FlgE
MFSGVSGLAAQSQVMGMIADNISNVNTVGYKRTTGLFSTLVTEPATETRYSPGGVRSRPYQLVNRQGLLQSSASPTDIAISGNGFFVVNTNGDPATPGAFMFSRSGAFNADRDGYLRNAAGLYLQGVPIPPTGVIPANPASVAGLSTVDIDVLNNSWQASTAASALVNLRSTQAVNANIANYGFGGAQVNMSDGTIAPDFFYDLRVFDSQGGSRTIRFAYLKSATPNQWFQEMYVVPATDADPAGTPAHPSGRIAQGTIAFNPDGTFNNVALTDATGGALGAGNLTTINWAPALGLAQSQITLDFAGSTQVDSASRLVLSNVNGTALATLTGVTISADGIVNALFDNGTSRPIYKIPLAMFANPNGLTNEDGNAWTENAESGPASLADALTQGAGKVVGGSLESSTVDLAEEFSNMIITQRAYSASGKIITTADEMLEELVRLKR